MRVSLNIPDDLIAKVQELTGEKSKTKAIITALQEFIRINKLRNRLALRGKIRTNEVTRKLH